MYLRQGGLCSICGIWMQPWDATFEHSDGRGAGAGHRDDRIEKNGLPYNSVAHAPCHANKGSVRLEAFLNEIVP